MRAALASGAVAIALVVAATRVLLAVHWLTDVAGGLALGWGWVAICALGARRVSDRERAGEEPVQGRELRTRHRRVLPRLRP